LVCPRDQNHEVAAAPITAPMTTPIKVHQINCR
jgi:hypothetical protein